MTITSAHLRFYWNNAAHGVYIEVTVMERYEDGKVKVSHLPRDPQFAHEDGTEEESLPLTQSIVDESELSTEPAPGLVRWEGGNW